MGQKETNENEGQRHIQGSDVYGEEKCRRGRGGKVAPQKPRLFNLVLVKNKPMQQLFLRIL